MPEFEVAVDVAVAPGAAWGVVRDMRILERADGVKLQERVLSRDEHEDPSVDLPAWMPHDHRAGLASLREYLEDR